MPASKMTSGGAPTGRTVLELHTHEVHPQPPDSIFLGSKTEKDNTNLTNGNNTRSISINGEKLVHKHKRPEIFSMANTSSSTISMDKANPNHRLMEDDAAGQAAATEQVPAKDAIRHRLQSELLNIHARLDQQQARDCTSFNTIQGELTKLKSMASQLAVSIGKQSSAAPSSSQSSLSSSFGASFVASTMKFASVAAMSASTMPPASAYVAPQVCGEMPQQYGLHNLNRHSLFRADGTKHSYFTLPADYPLERAVPEPVFAVYDAKSDGCSTESVHVLSGTPEQLTDEEEQRENLQASKCCNKPLFSPERPTAGTVGAFSLTDEQKPNNELTVVCVNKVLDNAFSENVTDVTSTHVPYVFVDVSIKCSMRNSKAKLPSLPDSELCGQHRKPQCGNNQQGSILMTEVRRKDWDLGILKTIMKIPPVVNWSSLEGLPHAIIFSPSILLSMIVYAATSIPNILVSLPLPILWDPGASTSLHSSKAKPPWVLSYVAIVFPEVLNLCNSWQNTVLQSIGDQVECLNPLSLTTPWDPGVLVMHSGTTRNSTRTTRDAEWLKISSSTKSELPQSLGVKCSPFHMMSNYLNAIFNVQMMQYVIQCLSVHLRNFVAPAIMCSFAFGLRWTEVTASVLFGLSVPCSTSSSAAKHYLLRSNGGNSWTNQYFPKLFMHSLCATTVLSCWLPSLEMAKL